MGSQTSKDIVQPEIKYHKNVNLDITCKNNKRINKDLSKMRKEIEKYKKSIIQLEKDRMKFEKYKSDEVRSHLNDIVNKYLKRYRDGILIETPEDPANCCICVDIIKKRITLVPCGHTVYCEDCAIQLYKCAICNSVIKNIMPIYL